MPETHDREVAAALARLAESWLALGVRLELPGMTLTVLALAILLLKAVSFLTLTCLVFVIVFGIAGKYYALRVALDRTLFLHWAERWENNTPSNPEEDMKRLDAALSSTGLRVSPPGPLRSLQSRQQGAFGLFRNQAILFLLQCSALLISAVAAQWGQ